MTLLPDLVFGRTGDAIPVPDLMELQVRAYSDFLQAGKHYTDREMVGLEAILREIFPIPSYDGSMSLE